MEYRGTVVKKPFGRGSKSEQAERVMLETNSGDSFVLRRPGKDPYKDPALNKLVGKRVVCHGNVHKDYLLFVDRCEEEPK